MFSKAPGRKDSRKDAKAKEPSHGEAELSDAQLQNVSGGDGKVATTKPRESVSFSFGKIETTYTPQKPDGT